MPEIVGKILIEDVGIGLGRTREWPAIPKGIYKSAPSSGSTTVKCRLCGVPWGGLVFEPDTDTFRHRQGCGLRTFI